MMTVSPPFDDQLGAGNVFGLVGREEQSCVRDIPGIAHAPHWALLVSAANHLLGTATVSGDDLRSMDHWRVHHPWEDRVHRMPKRAY
jgi:hypothetical protein